MHGSRSIDSHAKSHAAHRVALTSPRLLLLVVLALLVSAYALGHLPLPGVRPGIVFDVVHSVPLSLDPAFYGIAGFAAFLVLLALLRSCDILIRRMGRTNPLAPEPAKSLQQFPHEVSAAPVAVREIFPTVEAVPAPQPERSGMRDRSTDPPASAALTSTSTQRKALHAALNAGNAAGLAAGDAPKHQRRLTDYTGPRRRLTDKRVMQEYRGPFRRATDQPSPGFASEQAAVELHQDDPVRVASLEKPAVSPEPL